jgi:hypothetical protein
MRIAVRTVLLLVALTLAGCAQPGRPFGAAAAGLPPIPAGEARIFFYRWLEPYESTAATAVLLNGNSVAVTQTGSVLYRDVAPGQYTISIPNSGRYPGQFKTVVLAPGQVMYARVESRRDWAVCNIYTDACMDTFVVNLVEPGLALSEMGGLRFIGG